MCMCAHKYQLTTRHQNTTQSFPCHMQVKAHPLGLLYTCYCIIIARETILGTSYELSY